MYYPLLPDLAAIANTNADLCTKVLSLQRWLNTRSHPRVKLVKLTDGESSVQPFTRTRDNVTEKIEESIVTLEVGCGVWVRCTSNSPLDYLLVVRPSKTTAFVRFMDAKHTHNCKQLDRSIYDDLLPKAQRVHAELQRLLFTRLKITLDPFKNTHVAIVTNAPDGVNSDGAVVFCPTTFFFEPWTSLLFKETFTSLMPKKNGDDDDIQSQ